MVEIYPSMTTAVDVKHQASAHSSAEPSMSSSIEIFPSRTTPREHQASAHTNAEPSMASGVEIFPPRPLHASIRLQHT